MVMVTIKTVLLTYHHTTTVTIVGSVVVLTIIKMANYAGRYFPAFALTCFSEKGIIVHTCCQFTRRIQRRIIFLYLGTKIILGQITIIDDNYRT